MGEKIGEKFVSLPPCILKTKIANNEQLIYSI
jgi:hypothetical protein